MLDLNEAILQRLCAINSFTPPTDKMVFFGLRGCLPVDFDNTGFAASHQLELTNTNHSHARCTLGQWIPGKGIAVFSGSTVPHEKNNRTAKAKGGSGTNMLMTGYYNDYRKGRHKGVKPTGHDAFRQANKLPVRRSADDLDYDNDDRVEYSRAFDNLHAAWCQSTEQASFASAGCQVVVGYPRCSQRGNMPDTGPWKVFRDNAYDLDQQSFDYILLNGRDARKIAAAGVAAPQMPRLRYGSQGQSVSALQTALNNAGYNVGGVDGDFGWRTLSEVLEFQTDTFGDDADDGVVGPQTAAALGMTWENA